MFMRMADELNLAAQGREVLQNHQPAAPNCPCAVCIWLTNPNIADLPEAMTALGAINAPNIANDAQLQVMAIARLRDAYAAANAAGLPNPPNVPADYWTHAANTVMRYRPVDHLDFLERFWSAIQAMDRWYSLNPNSPEELFRRAMGQLLDFPGPHQLQNGNPAQNDRPPVPAPDAPAPMPPGIAVQGHVAGVPRPSAFGAERNPVWKHLIYAYAIENTRIVDVFHRVLQELLTGERLGRPTPTVMSWARTTEELFFSDRSGSWIFAPGSRLRDDPGAVRRNAYFRILGMDLNHGTQDGRPYAFVKPEAANRDFARTFEQLLRETWRGYANRNNQIGPNATDVAVLGDLLHRLQDMMLDRRISNALSREEFYSVATLSWFHLTVSCNNEVVTLLQAQGNNAAERLRAIGQRVGVAPHSRSYNYFQMANELSLILSRIESGSLSGANAGTLFNASNATTQTLLTIINHWSAASGRNLKEFVSTPEPGRHAALV